MSKQDGIPEVIRTAIRRMDLGKIPEADIRTVIDEKEVKVHLRKNNVHIRDIDTDKIVHANEVFKLKGIDQVNFNSKTLTDKYRVAQKEYRKLFVYEKV